MRIYDVSVPINERTPTYPGDPHIEIEQWAAIKRGDDANVTMLHLGAHTGTHVDAPAHFIEGAPGVSSMPLDVLVGEARVLEISDDVRAIEARHIASQSINGARRVLFKTRNSAFWANTAEGFESERHETHNVLLSNNVVIVEGLDLREVAAGDYELICLPLRITGGTGDGAPARVILRAED
jgi:arylformamidase